MSASRGELAVGDFMLAWLGAQMLAGFGVTERQSDSQTEIQNRFGRETQEHEDVVSLEIVHTNIRRITHFSWHKKDSYF